MEQRRIAVRGVILKDDKILCVKLKKTPGKDSTDSMDYWCTPGGGVDDKEPLIPALERELIEETGIAPVVGNLLYVQQFVHNGREQLEFFFHITNFEDYENIDLDQTTHGAIEIAEVDFVDPSSNTLLPAFLTEINIATDAKKGVAQVFSYIEK